MSKGESSSESTQSTSTQSTDARVGADNGAVVIQAGGQQNISFSPEVADAASKVVNSIVDFSGGVLVAANDIINKSIQAQENTTNAVLDFQQGATDALLDFGKSSLAASPATPAAASQNILDNQQTKQLTPALIAVIGGGTLLLIFMLTKRK